MLATKGADITSEVCTARLVGLLRLTRAHFHISFTYFSGSFKNKTTLYFLKCKVYGKHDK